MFHFVSSEIKKRMSHVDKYLSMKRYSCINRDRVNCDIELFKGYGINKIKRQEKLILSMTSYPKRIYDIHFAIYSLMKQTIKPDEFILWLSKEEFPNGEKDLPERVLKWKEHGLSIRFCENISSYKKIIPAYREYGDDCTIVTADDDVFYKEDWLEKLYQAHLKFPKDIIAHKVSKIIVNSDGTLRPYNSWPDHINDDSSSYLNFFIGVGGVLYPPKSLYKDVCNEDLFKKLSPTADDVWLWAMALMNNTKIRVVSLPYGNPIYTNADRMCCLTDDGQLFEVNCMDKKLNDTYLNNILKQYTEGARKIGRRS